MSSEAPVHALAGSDLEHILTGSCLLGSGGGGPLLVGRAILDHIGERRVNLIDPRHVHDDDLVAVSAFVGSPHSVTSGSFPHDLAPSAFRKLSDFIQVQRGRRIRYVLPGEIGAGNSLVPLSVGADLDLAVIDAAGAERAIPLLTMCKYFVEGLPMAPVIVCSRSESVHVEFGNESAEPLVRAMLGTPVFTQSAALAFWTMSGQEMRRAVFPNALSRARELGAWLASKPNTLDGCLRSVVVCKGHVSDLKRETRGGFDVGVVEIQDQSSGSTFLIYHQNENLLVWNDTRGAPVVMGPDIISYLADDYTPLSNADLSGPGQILSVVAAPASDESRRPEYVDQYRRLFRSIGYPGPYVPLQIDA